MNLAAPVVGYSGGLPYTASGALSVANLAPSGYNGLGFANGKLAADVANGPNPPAIYRMGLKFKPTGELYGNTVLPVAYYVNGWPVAANGTICVSLAP